MSTVRRGHYTVVGSTADHLRAALEALGPMRGGRRFGAVTEWEVLWRYRHREAPGGRRVEEVTVDVQVLITLPQWTPPRSAAAALVAAWEAFMAAVEVHEYGHVAIAEEAGVRVRERLMALPSFPSKEALAQAAAVAAYEALGGAREREAAYDAETRHGETQGVRLPADVDEVPRGGGCAARAAGSAAEPGA